MSVRYSTGLVNSVASGNSWNETLANSRLLIYSGAQPASADAEPNGDLLVTFTDNGGTYTAPTQTIAKLTVSGTTSGTVDTLTVGGTDATTGVDLLGGAIAHTGDHTTTAEAIASAVNAQINTFGIQATSSGADVLLSIPIAFGALFNTLNCYVAATTCTATLNGGTSNTLGGTGADSIGTDAANGLNFTVASNGVLSKSSSTQWSGVAGASGTAAWFRFVAGGSSQDGTTTTGVRFDGNIATSGGDLTLSNLTITQDATQTISAFTVTIPKT